MTDRLLCRVCDGRGFIEGGERGKIFEPCPQCSPSESIAHELARAPGNWFTDRYWSFVYWSRRHRDFVILAGVFGTIALVTIGAVIELERERRAIRCPAGAEVHYDRSGGFICTLTPLSR